IKVRYIDCAFNVFRREVFDKVTIESKKFFVDAEVLAKARYYGFRVVETGVRHYPRTAGSSTVRPHHVISTLGELARIWINIHSKPRGAVLQPRSASARSEKRGRSNPAREASRPVHDVSTPPDESNASRGER